MSRAVMQQALEALEWNYNTDLDNIPACEQWAKMLNETITALRAALAEPEQEPVAYLWQHGETGRTRIIGKDKVWTASNQWFCVGPLYLGSAPTPRKRVELSDLELKWIELRCRIYYDNDKYDLSLRDFARAVIAAYEAKQGEQHE